MIFTLRCPRCRAALFDWTDCMAVTCICRAGFCGWCFADCGDDAHAHAMNCDRNPNHGEIYARNPETVNRAHNLHREALLRNYLETKVAAAELPTLLIALEVDLRELGLKFRYP
jgi:hypothetical protein